MNGRTRIALCDDHPIVLAGLRNLLSEEAGFEVVGEATAGNTALRLMREQRPDVAIVDISMPEINGVLLTRRVLAELPELRVLILTLHEDRAYLRQSLDAGARGYVLKRSAAENLVHAIRAVLVGGVYVDPAVVDRVLDGAQARNRRQLAVMPDLTERETEVLKLAAIGFTNKEIAHRMSLGVKSVETFKARGLVKLGLTTRADLVRYAAGQGWLAEL
jgi:DNA-binding NarL/FixJ family response regulator